MTVADGDARSDRDLLDAHVAGDAEAFGVLFARHRDRLWAVALRTSGDPEEAADALQDALVSAFRRAGSFRGDSAVTTWLHRVVVNACLDRHRRASVRAADPLPDDLDRHRAQHLDRSGGLDGAGPTGPDQHPDQPEQALVRGELRDRVLDALRKLPPDQRAAVVLVDLESMSVAEAAAVLEVPTGTVKSRCSRGRARLAEHLADLVVRREPTHTGALGGTAGAAPASDPDEAPRTSGGGGRP